MNSHISTIRFANKIVTAQETHKIIKGFKIERVEVASVKATDIGDYPFDELQVGESWLMEGDERVLRKMKAHCATKANEYASEDPTRVRRDRSGREKPALIYSRRFRAVAEGDNKVRVMRFK